jgi:hypothetical protein
MQPSHPPFRTPLLGSIRSVLRGRLKNDPVVLLSHLGIEEGLGVIRRVVSS